MACYYNIYSDLKPFVDDIIVVIWNQNDVSKYYLEMIIFVFSEGAMIPLSCTCSLFLWMKDESFHRMQIYHFAITFFNTAKLNKKFHTQTPTFPSYSTFHYLILDISYVVRHLRSQTSQTSTPQNNFYTFTGNTSQLSYRSFKFSGELESNKSLSEKKL